MVNFFGRLRESITSDIERCEMCGMETGERGLCKRCQEQLHIHRLKKQQWEQQQQQRRRKTRI
jgi:hypothetical protein